MDAQAPELFRHYAKRAVRSLGDLVTDWVTFNEPNVYVAFGYSSGSFPRPPQRTQRRAHRFGGIMRSHAAAYEVLHREQPEAKVGLALHYVAFEAARDNVLDRQWPQPTTPLQPRSPQLPQGEPLPCPLP